MAITIQQPQNVSTLVGKWTHTTGDANESMTLGGHVWAAKFNPNKTSGGIEVSIAWSESVSGTISTLTIYNNATVTDGRFIVWYSPN